MTYKKIQDFIGDTPLVAICKMNTFANGSINLLKLEGNNPAGSVKDRPANNMIQNALKRGDINTESHLVEATSGNTGIALAMTAAIYGIKLTLIMPENSSLERKRIMRSYNANLILVSEEEGMEGARDLAVSMQNNNEGIVLDQFANDDNWLAHYHGTGPEIWKQTQGKITHFVSSMGTTGSITGCSRYLKEKNPAIRIIGVQPKEGDQIPGIRCWPEEYLPKFYDPKRVDEIYKVSAEEAKNTMLELTKTEGIFAGVSSGGALHIALKIAQKTPDSLIVSIVCDRGDRYVSTEVYDC